MKYPATKGYLPIPELEPLVTKVIEHGGFCFQHTNCENCNTRQEITEPNKFYMSILCEECGHETECYNRGCGFTAIYSNKPEEFLEMVHSINSEKH